MLFTIKIIKITNNLNIHTSYYILLELYGNKKLSINHFFKKMAMSKLILC